MNDKTIRLITMIGIWVAVILLLVSIITFVKNVDEIKNDPMIYGMKKHNLNYCSCINEEGTYTNIDLNEIKEVLG